MADAEDLKALNVKGKDVSPRNHVQESVEIDPPPGGRCEQVVNADPVEVALADALKRAAVAEQWSVVEVLTRELEARRRAHGAPNVVALDSKRGRRS